MLPSAHFLIFNVKRILFIKSFKYFLQISCCRFTSDSFVKISASRHRQQNHWVILIVIFRLHPIAQNTELWLFSIQWRWGSVRRKLCLQGVIQVSRVDVKGNLKIFLVWHSGTSNYRSLLSILSLKCNKRCLLFFLNFIVELHTFHLLRQGSFKVY